MGRSFGIVRALVIAAAGLVLPKVGWASDRSMPMRFELYRVGSPDGCGDRCKTIVSAVGAITADTPREFGNFVRSRNLNSATIVLDSDGGSVHGAIALGREIRRLALDTTVGRAVNVSNHDAVSYATISPNANCESMCAFVLLAGIHRTVPDQAQVMVHQIWLGDRREDPTAANYSAEDLVLVQRDIGRLAQYTEEMGISIDMLNLSLRIPPWEPMHTMTRDELHRMRVATDEPTVSTGANEASIKIPEVISPGQSSSNGLRVSEISERRWAVIDNSGMSALARRQPLTIEGEDVGNFDLLVSCSATHGSYDVNYIERRREGENTPLPKGIRKIVVQSPEREIKLNVVSSEWRKGVGELVTYASGPVPTALIDDFAANGYHSLTIQTKSGRLTTRIRIGNTGAQQNLSRLSSSCGKPLGDRAELEAMKTGGFALAK